MSKLVLHPRITKATDCTGAEVNVSVGRAGVIVGVEVDVAVLTGVTGEMTVTLEKGVSVLTKIGGGMMKGVAVTMPGVWVGFAVQTGKG